MPRRPGMPSANELPVLWRPHESVLRPPNFYRSGQSAAAFNGSSILFFGGCAHGQCHNDLMVLKTPSFPAPRTWAHARAVDFSGAPGGPSPRQGALLAVTGWWAWLIGGSGGDLTIDAYKLDLAPHPPREDGALVWLRPSIVGRPPPAAEHVSGAWMGSSVFTVGGCGRAGCHMAVHALDTTVQHGRHAWQQLQLVGGTAAPAPAPRGGHCVVASAALGGLLLHANANPHPHPHAYLP